MIKTSKSRIFAKDDIKEQRSHIYIRRGTGRIPKEIMETTKEKSTINDRREIIIETLAEFVSYMEKNHIDKMVLFRGQEENWSLIPKIARINLNYENPTILDAEKRMFNEFKRTSMPFLKTIPSSPWDWLALAQHHGMATRLLDWTRNPLAGLWFAIRNAPTSRDGKLQNGVVWVYDVNKDDLLDEKMRTNPFEGGRTMVFQPNHITPRIVAQQGWFTVHKYMDHERKFIPFEKITKYKDFLTKIIIPARSFGDIRNKLNLCGVNEYTLFPDLDGLCKYLVWDNSLLKDEENL